MSQKPPPSAGEVRALANQLLNWAERLAETQQLAYDLSSESEDGAIVRQAEAALAGQRLRARMFPDCDFGNPTWQIMLGLFLRQTAGYRTSLEQLALERELRAPTVYRCVEVLDDHGLLERRPDRFDARVVWLKLTDDGMKRMREFLRRSAGVGPQSAPRDLERQAG